MGEVAKALLGLLERGAIMRVEHDPEWPSPCEILPPDADGMVQWRPVLMDPPPTFDGVPLHPDLREFFGSFWGRSGAGRYRDEPISVRVAWNLEDLERIAGEVVAQIPENVPVCVAVSHSDRFFGVNNSTGAVWLCEPGYPPIEQVANFLAMFLAEVK